MEHVFELAKNKRIVLVIAEYPYVARASKSLASTLQLLIDKNKDTSKLFLVLCGSSMSYMEYHVLAYKAPLYERSTAQLKIQSFDFFETCCCFTKFTNYDKALAYGIVGGTPQYLMQLNDNLSIEVREPAIYNAAITAIATGSSKMNEISKKIDEDTSMCATYIKNLITLGIVKKNRRIAPEIFSYMGDVFENICKHYLWKLLLEGKCTVNADRQMKRLTLVCLKPL